MRLLNWTSLPDVPDREGFAGSFAGVAGGALFVAGGANFPDKRPWEGGTKIWYADAFLLEPNATTWRRVEPLPVANGYGVSVTLDEGVLLIGGGDAKRNFAEVWLATWSGGKLAYTAWPALPRPLALMAGARVGRSVYVAGGVERPDATQAQRAAYVLDLDRVNSGWLELPALPGAERILPVGGASPDAFYLFSGARLVADAAGKISREWLRDAYRFTPATGWRRLADLPRVAVAAPGLAPWVDGQLLVIGGDDGAQAALAPTAHQGFPRDVLAYDPVADKWTRRGDVPFSLVTTPLAVWRGQLVVPGGEARPGVRSPRVWTTTSAAR
jgi:N-acetylneuraminic acid mutarotase